MQDMYERIDTVEEFQRVLESIEPELPIRVKVLAVTDAEKHRTTANEANAPQKPSGPVYTDRETAELESPPGWPLSL